MKRLIFALLLIVALATAATPPNILWIVVEDQSAHYGPFGEKLAKTPHVDRLAREGVTFRNAFVTAPVCSPSRSALITGMYQTTIGAHHHRSSRSGEARIHLPKPVKLIPEMMRKAGYFVTNGRPKRPDSSEFVKGKTDYNFVYAEDLYDGADWAGRQPDQPFFAQIQLRGGKLRDQRTLKDRPLKTHGIDPAKVTIPPYYPDHPDIRKDWALYLESIEHTDWQVGQILARLEREGVLDETVVFFVTDHGVSHARGKQFLYEEGIRVPLVVRAPGRVPKGEVRSDLVAHIDIAASTLYFAGIDIPKWMEGRTLFGPDAQPREYVISARDRCDETVERLRSVRTARFKYIRNFYPARPHLQPNRYKDGKAIIKTIRALHAEGKLDKNAERLFTAPRPREELYDLETDPHELHNLAADPAHEKTMAKLRTTLDTWIRESGDKGPESPEAYNAEMGVYLKSSREPDVLRRNIKTMKKWASEGK